MTNKNFYETFIAVLESLVKKEINKNGYCTFENGIVIHNGIHIHEKIKDLCNPEKLTEEQEKVISISEKYLGKYELFAEMDLSLKEDKTKIGKLFHVEEFDEGIYTLFKTLNSYELIYMYDRLRKS